MAATRACWKKKLDASLSNNNTQRYAEKSTVAERKGADGKIRVWIAWDPVERDGKRAAPARQPYREVIPVFIRKRRHIALQPTIAHVCVPKGATNGTVVDITVC